MSETANERLPTLYPGSSSGDSLRSRLSIPYCAWANATYHRLQFATHNSTNINATTAMLTNSVRWSRMRRVTQRAKLREKGRESYLVRQMHEVDRACKPVKTAVSGLRLTSRRCWWADSFAAKQLPLTERIVIACHKKLLLIYAL